jgi:hypothetical protein
MVQRRLLRNEWIVLLAVLAIGACMIAGCSQPSDQGTTTTTTVTGTATPAGTGTTTPAGTATPVGTTIPATRPAPGSVQAIDFNLMLPFLPNAPAGWTAEDPQGATLTTQEGAYSFASREYTSGDKRATITIWDSAYFNIGGWDLWTANYQYSSTDGYWRTGTVGGYPSWESYDKSSNAYSTWVGVNQRFSVLTNVDDGSKADLDTFVNAVNYAGVAALT